MSATSEAAADAVDQSATPHNLRPLLDSGLWALVYVARQRGVMADPQSLKHELVLQGRCATREDLMKGAQLLGFEGKLVSGQDGRAIVSVQRPCILAMRDGRFVVLGQRLPNRKYVVLSVDGVKHCSVPQLREEWTGELVLLAKPSVDSEQARDFDLRWLLTALWRYRRPLSHVLIASATLQCLALVSPMMFQVVIDKVLLHKSLATLEIVVLGMLCLGAFEQAIQFLRVYALAHTGTRLDAEIGAWVFAHLVRLPLSYFESRPAGQTVARMRELETIRAFLTGHAATTIVDVLFIFVFGVVLAVYSWKLALIVAASLPLYIATVAIVRPLLRRRLQEHFKRGAASQQFLVESVVGAPTLKSAAAEPLVLQQWNERLSAYIGAAFRATTTGNAGSCTIQYIGRVTTALTLFFGAEQVIAGQMSVGQLVAFNMIAGLVSAPILRMSQLWQDIQQLQISVQRVGDIVRSDTEPHATFGSDTLPPVKGTVVFESVTFRYRAGGAVILKNLSLSIPPGQVIGIVGPSGSGKSTFAKLVQRLYIPEEGRVLIDDIDVSQVPPSWVRRNIGVVLQENLLFNRSIRDNIALVAPNLSTETVIHLARLAGAHDFIVRLPQGYDTLIEERGANLSGGQRQRIAIARALARNPRILIFDEATSALDYESEQVIERHMRAISKNRTVIVIAHRLAAVRGCDRIISLVDGGIAEDGSHDELLRNEGGQYRRLWDIQSGVRALGRAEG